MNGVPSDPPPLPWSARTEPERLTLLWSASAAVVAAFLLLARVAGWGAWKCVWKSCTGIPCAGCGGTRSLVLLGGGHWLDALAMNPGAVVVAAALAVLNVYALSVLVFHAEPWRPAWLGHAPWRWILGAAVAANWIYLVAVGAV